MQIRKATKADAQRICYLIKKNADHVLAKDYSKAQLLAWKQEISVSKIKENILKRNVFCAFQNNQLVGTISLDKDWLVGLYIAHSRIGEGFGKKLLNYVEQIAKEQGINQLQLTATPNGYGFYLKNGFEPKEKVKLYYNTTEFIETKMTKNISKNKDGYKLDFNELPWVNIQPGMSEKKAFLGNKSIRFLKLESGFIEKDWCDKPHFGFVLEGQFKIDFSGKKHTYKKGDGINIEGGANQLHKAIIEKGDKVELVLIDYKH